MSQQTQMRRGTAAQNSTFTGAAGEVTVDTTNGRLHVHDGSTSGGLGILGTLIDLQKQSSVFVAGGGTADVTTLTLDPAPASYTTGMRVAWTATGTNTTGVTLNVNGLGAKNLYKVSSGSLTALTAGDLVSGVPYSATYDGTQFVLGDGGGGGGNSGVQAFTSSGTWTRPAGVTTVLVLCTGGGGGAGGGKASSGFKGGDGAAGASGFRVLDVSAISSVTVTVGSGGSGGVGGISPQPGTAGGDTTFGSYLTGGGGGAGSEGNTGNGTAGADATTTNADFAATHLGYTSFFGDTGRGAGGRGNTNNTGGSGQDGVCLVLEF